MAILFPQKFAGLALRKMGHWVTVLWIIPIFSTAKTDKFVVVHFQGTGRTRRRARRPSPSQTNAASIVFAHLIRGCTSPSSVVLR